MTGDSAQESHSPIQLEYVTYGWIPAEHLSMAPGHSQVLGGAGW